MKYSGVKPKSKNINMEINNSDCVSGKLYKLNSGKTRLTG